MISTYSIKSISQQNRTKVLIFLMILLSTSACKEDDACDEKECSETTIAMISQTYEGYLYVDGLVDGNNGKCDSLETTVEIATNPNDSKLLSISILTDPPEIDTVINSYEVRCTDEDCAQAGIRLRDTNIEVYFGGIYYSENDSIRVSFHRPYSICDSIVGPRREYDFYGVGG